ncbi:MAG: replication-relaxation family protein [Myxococcota bacterium]
MAEGDIELIQALYRYRYLRSGQLSRLTERSSQVIRRRLRWLAGQGYVQMLARGKAEQAAYSLARGGFEFVAHASGVPVSALPFSRKIDENKTASFFWRHTMLVNDVVIAFEQALEEHPRLALEEVIQEWELADPRAKAHHRRFRLSERFEEGGRVLIHRPDACLLLRPRGEDGAPLVAAYLEADRATEPLRRIRGKIEGFYAYWLRERFVTLRATSMRVLFVLGNVRTDKRIRSMQRTLETFAKELATRRGNHEAKRFVSLFRFARAGALGPGVIDEALWMRGLEQVPSPFLAKTNPQLELPFEKPAA